MSENSTDIYYQEYHTIRELYETGFENINLHALSDDELFNIVELSQNVVQYHTGVIGWDTAVEALPALVDFAGTLATIGGFPEVGEPLGLAGNLLGIIGPDLDEDYSFFDHLGRIDDYTKYAKEAKDILDSRVEFFPFINIGGVSLLTPASNMNGERGDDRTGSLVVGTYETFQDRFDYVAEEINAQKSADKAKEIVDFLQGLNSDLDNMDGLRGLGDVKLNTEASINGGWPNDNELTGSSNDNSSDDNDDDSSSSSSVSSSSSSSSSGSSSSSSSSGSGAGGGGWNADNELTVGDAGGGGGSSYCAANDNNRFEYLRVA